MAEVDRQSALRKPLGLALSFRNAGSGEGRKTRPVEPARKALRLIRRIWRSLASGLLLSWYKAQFAGLRTGSGLVLGRGTYISLACGGRLIIGDNVRIAPNVHLTVEGGMLEIGDDCFIGDGAIIVAVERISIGRDALIASYVTVRDQNHGFDQPGLPYRAQPAVSAPIVIEPNVWLGTHATVLKGVTIGHSAIVGANAVVTGDLPAGMLCVGVPARPVKAIATDAKRP